MKADDFKRKFMPLHPKLYRVAIALVGNKEDAEDILQETYGKLWLKRDELGQLENPEAYCVTMIKNLCLDFLRSAQVGQMTDEDAEMQMDMRITDKTPDRILEEKEQLRQVRQIINRLPQNQKKVIRLQGIAGCSIEEIENLTGLSNGNIRVLLSRARKQIQEQINKLYQS